MSAFFNFILGVRRSFFGACVAGAFVGFALNPGKANAACGGTNSYAACSDVNISLLYIEATSNAYMLVDGNPQALPCTLNGGYITLPGSAPKFNAVYATLLTAHSTKRKVTIRVVPNEANQCVVAYVTLAAQ